MQTKVDQLKMEGKIDDLVSIMQTGADWMDRLDAAEALAQLGDSRGVAYLNGTLNSNQSDVRQVAKEILEGLGVNVPEMPASPAYSPPRERPGCVTAYAVLLFISAGLAALGGLIAGLSMMSDSAYQFMGLGIMVVILIVAGLYFLLGRGLWQLKNWARIIVMILQGLGLLGSLLSMCNALSLTSNPGFYGYQSDPTGSIIGGIVGLAIGGYILYWFAVHAEYFD
jgi:hypothetical protein